MENSHISVLYFTNTRCRGGVETHILTLLTGLDRRRFRPYLACPNELLQQLASEIPSDVKTFSVTLASPVHFGGALRLAHILRSHQIDILHSHMFQSSLFASPLGWLCGVPLIIETPHVREDWRRGWFKSKFWVDQMVGFSISRYLAVSEANARYLAESKRLPVTKIVTIRNGCELSRFDLQSNRVARLRQLLGITEGDRTLVVVARLEPQKGHRVLISAMPTILRQFPRTRAFFVGSGRLEAQLREQARSEGVSDRVLFAGFQSNVSEWFAVADVVVLPSYYEGLPMVLLEALAVGRPIVATSVDGTSEVIVDGESGLTVPPGDPSALAGAICRVLKDPDFAVRLAVGGRQRVQEHFSAERQLKDTQHLYSQALERWRCTHNSRAILVAGQR